MPKSLLDLRTALNEKRATIMVTLGIAILTVLDQVSLIGATAIFILSAVTLHQLEIRHRLQLLANKRTKVRVDRRTHREGVMSLRTHALNQLPSPTLLIDHKHKIIFANDAVNELLDDDLTGKDAFLYLRQPKFIEAIDSALQPNAETEDPFGSIRYTSNSDRSFDVTIAPIPEAEEDEPPQVIVFFYEVTSLLRTEQMRVDFVANASHELRTPLTSVLGFIETLQGPARDDDDARERFLGIMQREAERMTLLIDDLLSLSRIEMSRHVAPETSINVELIVSNAVNSVLKMAEKRGITLKTSFADSLPQAVADGDQITQVILNLLVNAAKYADQDSTVYIEAEKQTNDQLSISVRDEGPGIAPEHLARLTERFYRIDTARSRQMGGTGLGLAIVKHILLRHNSHMDIRSKLGEGTKFSFNLAVAENSTES